MNRKTFSQITAILFLMFSFVNSYGQQTAGSGPESIERLIAAGKIDQAKKELNTDLEQLKASGKYDSLIVYIPIAGSFALAEGNTDIAVNHATQLANLIVRNTSEGIKAKALNELCTVLYSAKRNDRVVEVASEAISYLKTTKKGNLELLATLEYNLGTALLNLGEIERAKTHLDNAKAILEKLPGKNLQQLYNTYNSTGRYFASKSQLDSSTHYYKKAVSALENMDKSEEYRDYWKAIVNNNISLNLQNTGRTREAISFIRRSIENYQGFIETATDENKKSRAVQYRLGAIDNLGTFYHGLGEYNKAIDIFTYSYKQKIKKLGAGDPNVVISLVILSHGHLSAKNYELAGQYADKALAIIAKNPSNYTFLHSYIVAIRASVYEALDKMEEAAAMYSKSEALFMQGFDGTYSKDYLDTMIIMSQFYAEHGEAEKATELALAGYEYTQQDKYQNALIRVHHIQNMAKVHFELGNFETALKFSEEALNYFDRKDLLATSLADSIQIEFTKPQSLLINAQAKFNLQPHTESSLKTLLQQVKQGIEILERRKTIINSADDVRILIDDNRELFDFAKQLYLELYRLTSDEKYMLDLVTIHESSMYNRIRSRLNIHENIGFAGVPKKVIEREQRLKKNFSKVLSKENDEKFDPFFSATGAWSRFLDTLKQQYPKYYKMRYATIESSLDELQQKMDKETTLIRYFFIEDELYAFVVNKSKKSLYTLDYERVKDHIPQLIANDFKVARIKQPLHQLYTVLWKPLEAEIKTERVTIIPDRELYNLSFELLTPSPISSFDELASNSLLAKHTISYNFSLLMEQGNTAAINSYKDNFIAFVPEFSEGMKRTYKIAIKDTLSLDQNYLTLLPQPFSADLAKEYSKVFDGRSFVNERASKQVFMSNAKEHKIIHIGTHAESNNVRPELSRLIFAKDLNASVMNPDSVDNNYLYTYEIYDQNLSSNLAILTACETGKPGFSAGEGMISLAHAFTYAGSESILTSLWKIDEKSSAEILTYFYDNLDEGMAKDEALKQAKLTYLNGAEGRELAPQYWAGLILMGDSRPIELDYEFPFWPWFIGGILILILVFIIFRTKGD